MLSYALNKEIPVSQIISGIQKLVSKEAENLSNKVLSIAINDIIYDDNSNIPKIEYHE